jgi:hypothetical protein
VPRGIRNLTGTLTGHNQLERAGVATHRGAVERAGAPRVGRERVLVWVVAPALRHPAAARALEAARHGGARARRHRGWQAIPAILPRPPRASTHRHAQCGFGLRSPGGAGLLGSPGGLRPSMPCRPLGSRLGVQGVALGQCGDALLTRLERATPRRGRAGAPVSYRSRQASRDGHGADCTPSHLGTKHLEDVAPSSHPPWGRPPRLRSAARIEEMIIVPEILRQS